MGRKPNPPRRKPPRKSPVTTVKTGGRALKSHEIARAIDPSSVPAGLPVAGGDPRSPDVVETHVTRTMELLVKRTPRVEIAAALGLSPYTADQYIARARERLVAIQHATQKELLADSQARVEWLAAHGGLESRDQVQAERLLAELRGLLGVRGSVVVNQLQQVNIGAAAGQPEGDLSRLSSAAQVVLEWLTAVYEGEMVTAPVDALRQLLGEVAAPGPVI